MIRIAVVFGIHNEFESLMHSVNKCFALWDVYVAILDQPESGPFLDMEIRP